MTVMIARWTRPREVWRVLCQRKSSLGKSGSGLPEWHLTDVHFHENLHTTHQQLHIFHSQWCPNISAQAKDDLVERAGFLKSKHKWLPFTKEFFAPLIWHKQFVSDAAGLCDTSDPASEPGWNVCFREDGMIIFAKSTLPPVFIQQKKDKKHTWSDLTSPLSTRGI